MLARYQTACPRRFENILYIDEVEHFSEDKDGECFDEIALALKKYNLDQVLSVTLLHFHFVTHDHEVLVEYVDHEQRDLSTKPIEREDMPENIVATSWRMIQGNDGYDIHPVQYSADLSGEPLDFSDQNLLGCFGEIASILDKYDALGRFGLAQIVEIFETKEGEYLIETTDVEDRVSTTRPLVVSEAELNKSIQTSWQFDIPMSYQAIFRCKTKRKTWCSRTCETRCKGPSWDGDCSRTVHKARHKKNSESVHYS